MAAPDLVIGIGAEYVGAPAFAKANRSVNSLQKSVKSLGRTFAGVFAAQKLIAYGKASAIAFNQDNQAAKSLTGTLDALGLAFEDSRVKTLIAGLEKTYKVADDLLRPAMQSLLQVTGSVSKSQSILETALNASAGTGTDLATVTNDLAQAYVGNLKGLRKYNLGLTQAELKSKSFSQIQELVNKKFKEQALIKAADPMNALALAANNAQETIGKGLFDAISNFVGAEGDINKVTDAINNLATSTSKALGFLGTLGNVIAQDIQNSNAAKIVRFFKKDWSGQTLMAKGSYAKGGGKAIDIAAGKRAQAEKDQIARNKEITKQMQAQAVAAAAAAKAKKEAAILEKANLLFNMDLIQNVAALQGKITDDEKLRLQTQQALLTGNAQSAGELAQKLLAAQEAALKARQADPFLGWPSSAAEALKAIESMIDALKKLGIASQTVPIPASMASAIASGTYYVSSTGVASTDTNAGSWSQYYNGTSGGLYGSTPVNNSGSIDINLNVVNGDITASLQNQSITGTPASIYRINPINNG
jgi:hypothetical protein